MQPLECRFALSGQGFEVETPWVDDGDFSADGVVSPGEWGGVEPLAYMAIGSNVPPTRVAFDDPDANSTVRTVIREGDREELLWTAVFESEYAGPIPAEGWTAGTTVFEMQFLGFESFAARDPNSASQPSHPNADRILNLSGVAARTGSFDAVFSIDVDDDGEIDKRATEVDIQAAMTVQPTAYDTFVITVEVAGPLNVQRGFGGADSPLSMAQQGPFATTSYVSAFVTDADRELNHAVGYQYRINRLGLTTAKSDVIIPQQFADADILRISRWKVDVAIMSTANFDATVVDATTLNATLFDSNGAILQHLQPTRTKLRDINNDGRLDLVFVLEFDRASARPDVDGADFVVWKRAYDDTSGSEGEDFLIWQQQFGIDLTAPP